MKTTKTPTSPKPDFEQLAQRESTYADPSKIRLDQRSEAILKLFKSAAEKSDGIESPKNSKLETLINLVNQLNKREREEILAYLQKRCDEPSATI